MIIKRCLIVPMFAFMTKYDTDVQLVVNVNLYYTVDNLNSSGYYD
jgi:hypothetical protein